MKLEEAIKHAEAVAIENEKEAKRKREHGGWYYDSEARACAICAEENRQLAEWLQELKERRKDDSCEGCYYDIGRRTEICETCKRMYIDNYDKGERRTDDKTNKGSSC